MPNIAVLPTMVITTTIVTSTRKAITTKCKTTTTVTTLLPTISIAYHQLIEISKSLLFRFLLHVVVIIINSSSSSSSSNTRHRIQVPFLVITLAHHHTLVMDTMVTIITSNHHTRKTIISIRFSPRHSNIMAAAASRPLFLILITTVVNIHVMKKLESKIPVATKDRFSILRLSNDIMMVAIMKIAQIRTIPPINKRRSHLQMSKHTIIINLSLLVGIAMIRLVRQDLIKKTQRIHTRIRTNSTVTEIALTNPIVTKYHLQQHNQNYQKLLKQWLNTKKQILSMLRIFDKLLSKSSHLS